MTRPQRNTSRIQQGAALLEALVALLIVAFGVLGFVGLQARTAVGNLEGYQRAQALVLVHDMAQRMNANRKNLESYLGQDIGTGPIENCGALTGAARDLCEWGNLIRGAAERDADGKGVGAMIGAYGCIAHAPSYATTGEYLVAVYWRGVQASGDTRVGCDSTPPADPDPLRRGVSIVVRVGALG